MGVQSIFKTTKSTVIYILILFEFRYKRALKFLPFPFIIKAFLWRYISAYTGSASESGDLATAFF